MIENVIMVSKLEVRRADDIVALVFEIDAEELARLQPGEPVSALACFQRQDDLGRICRALEEAEADAAASGTGEREGQCVDGKSAPRGENPSPGSPQRGSLDQEERSCG